MRVPLAPLYGATVSLAAIWSGPGNRASGRVAQLVERAPEKREVTGSMPVPTTDTRAVHRHCRVSCQDESKRRSLCAGFDSLAPLSSDDTNAPLLSATSASQRERVPAPTARYSPCAPRPGERRCRRPWLFVSSNCAVQMCHLPESNPTAFLLRGIVRSGWPATA